MVRMFCLLIILVILLSPAGRALAGETLTFGVNPQRSVVITVQYWNPILRED